MDSIRMGFIGLGNMGMLMARYLAKSGLPLIVYDLNRKPVEEMKLLGAQAAGSCREVAAASDVVISMVRDISQTDEVIFGRDGVWEGIKKGAVIVISSTLSPSYCQNLYRRAKERGVKVVDAAVSAESRNFTPGQESAELTLMVGGDKEAVDYCLPVFRAIAKNVFRVGGIGMGQACKLVNNLAMYGNTIVAQECLNLGIKAGLELDTMLKVMSVSTGFSRGLRIAARRILEQPPDAQAPAAKAVTKSLGDKDRELAIELADAVGANTPVVRFMAELDIKLAYDAYSAIMRL